VTLIPPRQEPPMNADWRRCDRRTSAFIGVDRRFQTSNCPLSTHAPRTKLDRFV